MFVLRILLVVLLLDLGASYASGWHDYSVEIAPGFSVYRMNNFEVCLGQTGGSLLTCPSSYPGQVGPLVEYAVTKDFILAHHAGVRPDERNPSMPSGDPNKAFYFAVRRS